MESMEDGDIPFMLINFLSDVFKLSPGTKKRNKGQNGLLVENVYSLRKFLEVEGVYWSSPVWHTQTWEGPEASRVPSGGGNKIKAKK